jgi:hypothetical protein
MHIPYLRCMRIGSVWQHFLVYTQTPCSTHTIKIPHINKHTSPRGVRLFVVLLDAAYPTTHQCTSELFEATGCSCRILPLVAYTYVYPRKSDGDSDYDYVKWFGDLRGLQEHRMYVDLRVMKEVCCVCMYVCICKRSAYIHVCCLCFCGCDCLACMLVCIVLFARPCAFLCSCV